MMKALRDRGVLAALGAALLFGASTPFAKALLGTTEPWLLAGLLYLGSGTGLFLYRRITRQPPVRLPAREVAWLGAAIASGGMVAPAILMAGLSNMPASGAALLLNAEGVFTALLAWFAFRENFDRRIALGMALIVAGAVLLSWPGEASFGAVWPALAVLGACFAWGLDNNFTRKVALNDPTYIAMAKGLVAGGTNVALALMIGARLPEWTAIAGAAVLGFLSYGVSLALFVVALRELGTARTGAYFSIAPFAGALLALPLLGESPTMRLAAAGVLMAGGVWLHLSERHEHAHRHGALVHDHDHEHDEHHQHPHDHPVRPGERHSHVHTHTPMEHSHSHYPDAHHRHEHH